MFASRATLIAVIVLIGAATAAHGVATSRWNGGDVSPTLPEIPMQFGAWSGANQPSDFSAPGIAYLSRRYVNKSTGRTFIVSLSMGHPGLTAVHTPEYCYTGSGYDMTAPVSRRQTEGAEFFTTVFQKPGAANESIRIFWAWSADGTWRAPGYPRLAFLGRPTLCKLYVVSPGGVNSTPGNDPALDDFLDGLRGTLNAALFPRS